MFLAEQVAALGGQELFNPEADGVEVMVIVPLATGAAEIWYNLSIWQWID